jgi:U3 small nucleolar RNA-associated protein 20
LVATLRDLFTAVSPNVCATLHAYLFAWLAKPNPQLVISAAQVLGFALQVLGDRFQPNMKPLVQNIHRILTQDSKAHPLRKKKSAKKVKFDEGFEGSEDEDTDNDEDEDAEDLDDGEASLGHWKVTYFVLIALEKAAVSMPGLVHKHIASLGLWDTLCELLVAPHTWLRLVASRIIGQYLGTLQMDAFGTPSYIGGTMLQTQHRMFQLTQKCCTQLSSPLLDQKLGQQVVKNLMFLTLALSRMPSQATNADEAVGEGDEKKGNKTMPTSPTFHSALNWIFTRCSYLARNAKSTITQRDFVFRFFGAMAVKLPADSLTNYLVHMLQPLYRVASSGASAPEIGKRKMATSSCVHT